MISTKIVYGYNNYNEKNIEAKEQTYTMGIKILLMISGFMRNFRFL